MAILVSDSSVVCAAVIAHRMVIARTSHGAHRAVPLDMIACAQGCHCDLFLRMLGDMIMLPLPPPIAQHDLERIAMQTPHALDAVDVRLRVA